MKTDNQVPSSNMPLFLLQLNIDNAEKVGNPKEKESWLATANNINKNLTESLRLVFDEDATVRQ